MTDDGAPTKRLRQEVAGAPRKQDRRPGERVGNWVVGNVVGGGGFGDVYEAHHHATHQPVALKVLQAHFTTSAEMLARFDREVQLLSRLDHPNIVKVIEAGFDDGGRPYLCMELLTGEDLGTVVRNQQRLGLDAVLDVLEPLCDAVTFAHDLGIVHRDIKASNVFVCQSDGRIVLLDFGIAKLLDALAPELTTSNQALGTPGCMAPEQIHGLAIDPRTDVYALGGLLFHLVTGRMPFSDPSETMTQYLHLHARRPRASAVAGVPRAIDDVIMRAMAIDPSPRFESARAFLEATRNAVREGPQLAAPTTVEHAAIFVMIEDSSGSHELDETLIADLEAVLPAAERSLGEHGFTLVVDLGTSALFVAPERDNASALAAARATWDALQRRAGRDARVRVGMGVHRGLATVIGDRVQPCPLLRPETWGMPEPLEGVWATAAVEPVA